MKSFAHKAMTFAKTTTAGLILVLLIVQLIYVACCAAALIDTLPVISVRLSVCLFVCPIRARNSKTKGIEKS